MFDDDEIKFKEVDMGTINNPSSQIISQVELKLPPSFQKESQNLTNEFEHAVQIKKIDAEKILNNKSRNHQMIAKSLNIVSTNR